MFFIHHYPESRVLSELHATLISERGASRFAFSPKKDTEAMQLFHYLSPIVNVALEILKKTVLAHQKSPPRGAKHLFTINCARLIGNVERDFLKAVEDSSSTTAAGCGSREGAPLSADAAIIKKICGIFSKYFTEHTPIFSLRDDHRHALLTRTLQSVVVDLYQAVYEDLGFARIEIPPSFSDETLREFMVPKGIKLADPQRMSCYEFACLYTKEKRARSTIFREPLMDDPLDHIYEHLREWKYSSVECPSTGDLVVYVQDDKRPMHVGVYQESGKILSKLGINQPCCHEHDLFDVPAELYGRKVLFFRKPSE